MTKIQKIVFDLLDIFMCRILRGCHRRRSRESLRGDQSTAAIKPKTRSRMSLNIRSYQRNHSKSWFRSQWSQQGSLSYSFKERCFQHVLFWILSFRQRLHTQKRGSICRVPYKSNSSFTIKHKK